jgi:hypothetical protein
MSPKEKESINLMRYMQLEKKFYRKIGFCFSLLLNDLHFKAAFLIEKVVFVKESN